MMQRDAFTIETFAGMATLVKRIINVYMAFSVITAIALVVIRIDQAVMQVVLVNTQITAAFGFMVSGIAGFAGILAGEKRAFIIFTIVLGVIAYLVIFVIASVFLKILGGFSL